MRDKIICQNVFVSVLFSFFRRYISIFIPAIISQRCVVSLIMNFVTFVYKSWNPVKHRCQIEIATLKIVYS